MEKCFRERRGDHNLEILCASQTEISHGVFLTRRTKNKLTPVETAQTTTQRR
jgi:hypothetical protein